MFKKITVMQCAKVNTKVQAKVLHHYAIKTKIADLYENKMKNGLQLPQNGVFYII